MWTAARGAGIAGGMAALILGLAGCSSSAHDSTVAAGSSSSAGANSAVSASPASAGGAAGSAATADGSLSEFIAAIVDGDYQKACQDMAAPSGGATSGPLEPATAAQCAPGATPVAGAPSPLTELRDLHISFTPKNAAGHAAVHVAGGEKNTGGKVTVHANQIAVDGQSLVQVVVSHSTGVTAANLDISFEMTRIAAAWYVSNMNINI